MDLAFLSHDIATHSVLELYIKELEQQIRPLKEQAVFLPRKLYGTKSEKTSVLQIERQMSLFNEVESCADPDATEPGLTEVEAHLRNHHHRKDTYYQCILVYIFSVSYKSFHIVHLFTSTPSGRTVSDGPY